MLVSSGPPSLFGLLLTDIAAGFTDQAAGFTDPKAFADAGLLMVYFSTLLVALSACVLARFAGSSY